MSFDDARQIADAVLLEGYVLYPYRASAPKNQFRWAFGVLGPRAWSEGGGCEPWWMQTECLIEATPTTRIDVRLRFLHNRRRRIERRVGDAFERVEAFEHDGRLHLPWDEGEVREIDFGDLRCPLWQTLAFDLPASEHVESLGAVGEAPVGRVVRRCRSVCGLLHVHAESVHSERSLLRLRLRVENTTPWADADAPRDAAIEACLIATHLLLEVSDGSFLSLLDPPTWAAQVVERTGCVRSFPVLVGRPGQRNMMLAAPIIMYDYPKLAPESPGDLYDATEIDELLTIRTRTLTEQEKRHARATDPRAARVIDQVDRMPPQVLQRLHGAMRDLEQAQMVPRGTFPPSQPSVEGFAPGGRVRLRPGKRRTDAQDLLFAGCPATIQAVLRDVDDREVLAVTIDDDPAAELHQWYGRFHYYYPDEVELLEEEAT